MRRLHLAAAAALAFIPLGGPAEAGERQLTTAPMAEKPTGGPATGNSE